MSNQNRQLAGLGFQPKLKDLLGDNRAVSMDGFRHQVVEAQNLLAECEALGWEFNEAVDLLCGEGFTLSVAVEAVCSAELNWVA